MSGFSSQWLVNVIASHPDSTVIWDFIRRRTCVCSCDKREDRENMKKDEIVCVCVCVTPETVFVLSNGWALNIENCRDLNALLRNVIFLFSPRHYALLHYTLAVEMETHIHLLAASYIFITTFVQCYDYTALFCLLRHTIPFHRDIKWRLCRMGEKMLLMFHLCLTFSFFRVAFQRYI